MKLLDIISKVGGDIIKKVVPGGGLIIDAVNQYLPSEQKLGTDAKGTDLQIALQRMTVQQQTQLMNREFDVEITQIKEENATLREFLKTEAASPHTTRPKIASRAFWVVAIVTLMIAAAWLYAVLVKDQGLVKAIMDGWPFVVSIVAPFVVWLNQYFGVLARESKNKLNATLGQASETGIAGLIKSTLKK